MRVALARAVGVLAELLLRPERRRLVVGTTHLYWDPAMEHVKNAQAAFFLAKATHFMQRCSAGRAARLRPGPPGARAFPAEGIGLAAERRKLEQRALHALRRTHPCSTLDRIQGAGAAWAPGGWGGMDARGLGGVGARGLGRLGDWGAWMPEGLSDAACAYRMRRHGGSTQGQGQKLPLILGGDFNSLPDSGVYAALTKHGAPGLPPLARCAAGLPAPASALCTAQPEGRMLAWLACNGRAAGG